MDAGGNVAILALVTLGIAALLTNIFERRQEARNPYVRFVEVDETRPTRRCGASTGRGSTRASCARWTTSGRATAAATRFRARSSTYPWLRTMWAGHAFSIDYRESRGHAYALHDQDHTERVAQRPQPGACLHCHAAVMPAYRATSATAT
jgi:nitrite reductase (cytochrome c-552)